METRFVSNNQENVWNSFIIENNGSFLQSFEWGRFQESLGNKVFFLQAAEQSNILAQALVIKHKFPLGLKSYFYIPYGPYFSDKNARQLIFDKVGGLSKKEGAVFLHIEPSVALADGIGSEKRIQPQKTLVLDINAQEKDIFVSFPKDTRYSIRIAEKNGVRVGFENTYSSEFYALLKKTARLDNFKVFGKEHYEKLFGIASDDFKVKMCLAKYKEKLAAASILVLFGKKATYLHAASDKNLKALQAPSFLLWEQVKLAKSLGCEIFDFWGIDEKKWPGVTNFKKSFGGKEVSYGKSRDIIFSGFWYNMCNLAKKLR